ncbi:unnamed protein product [Rotaria sp. Silwood2]|nr:unnamed protein product [Rotaria sp. Silwood2]CAF3304365.1 unnamed protein product [Rotaria sp. Silwood2]CAF4006557.1 unnamed protein product [Rotaria sp. Silwood2]
MPLKARKLLEEIGDEPILEIQLGRRPVKDLAIKILNFLSHSKFADKQYELGYDEIYHNYLLITVQNNHGFNVVQNIVRNAPENTNGKTVLVLEKSFRIGLRDPVIPDEMIDLYDILLPPNKSLTLNQLITTTLYAEKDFFVYDAGENNTCQTFVKSVLESNGLMPNIVDEATLEALEPIDSKTLVATLDDLSGLVKLTTDIAAKLHRLLSDRKIKLKSKKRKAKQFISLSNANIISSETTIAMYNAMSQIEHDVRSISQCWTSFQPS